MTLDLAVRSCTMHDMVAGGARDLASELRRGVVEYCVLALLRERESYAFEIVRVLEEQGLIASEGTIYPLLSRLRRDGSVVTVWRESDSGPPRRYHRLTPRGRAALDTFSVEWAGFRTAVDAILQSNPSEGGPDGS
jgi:PadR family transcriptional regulator PadR